jgi:hypothetical protein
MSILTAPRRAEMPSHEIKKSRLSKGVETFQQLPDRAKKLGIKTVGVSVLLGTSYGVVMSGQVEADKDDCTDLEHQQVVVEEGKRASVRSFLESFKVSAGEQTAAGISMMLTNERGYSITESQVIKANKPDLFSDEKLKSGIYCIDVPGPVYSGFTRSDGDTSLKDLAVANMTSVENLQKLNPSLSKKSADTELKEGLVVQVDLEVNKDYFYREMAGEEQDINTLAENDAKLRDQILSLNGAILGTGGSVSDGSEAWLPAITTDWMENNEFIPADIAQAFPISEYTREAPAVTTERSTEEATTNLNGFEPGFSGKVLESARKEVELWPKGETDVYEDVENNNPYIKKYTEGPLGAKESWCADFVRYTLNKAGADIDTSESLDGDTYYMRRVKDVYNWMVNGENGSFYVYGRDDIVDSNKTTYQPGDVMFLNYNGSKDDFMASKGNHIGIVSETNGDEVTFIDGNSKADKVSETVIDQNDAQIIAIARPIEATPEIGDIVIPPQPEYTLELIEETAEELVSRGAEWSNRAIVMRELMEYGLTDYQAAGLIGNTVTESGSVTLPPAIEQYGGGPGIGIVQWEGSRKEALIDFADAHDTSWDNLDTQIAFIMHEFETTESNAYEWLKNTSNVEEAANAVLNGYERPAARILEPRKIHAEEFLKAWRETALG